MSDGLRGQGVGNRLIATALAFCRDRGYGRVYLWTFEGLEAARRLYETNGFRTIEQRKGRQWGTEVDELRYELSLRLPAS